MITYIAQNNVLTEYEMPTPQPQDNEILIEVIASGMNRADLLQVHGRYYPPVGVSQVLGLECAGIVLEVGRRVRKWSKGDVVCALVSSGGFAQYCIAHEHHVLSFNGLSLEELAALPEVFITAYASLFYIGRLKPREKVLIHAGGSGVGTAAIQLAKTKNAQVIVTCSTEKVSLCEKLGADIVVDYTKNQFEDILLKEYPFGMNLILDTVGPSYWAKNINSLSIDGRMIMIGLLSGYKFSDAFLLGHIVSKRLQIKGVTLRNIPDAIKTVIISNFVKDFGEYLIKKRIKPCIDSVFRFDEIKHAFDRMSNNRNQGKILLKW